MSQNGKTINVEISHGSDAVFAFVQLFSPGFSSLSTGVNTNVTIGSTP